MIKSAFAYLLANLTNKAIPFLLVPILTRYLNPGDYGTMSIFLAIVSFATLTTGFRTDVLLVRQYANSAEQGAAKPLLAFASASCLMHLILAVVFYGLYQPYLNLSLGWVLLAIITGLFIFIGTLALAGLQARDKVIPYAAIQILHTLLQFSLIYVFVVVMALDWTGRSIATAIAAACFCLVGIVYLGKVGALNGRLVMSTWPIVSAAPFFFVSVNSILISTADKIILLNLSDNSTVGIYAVGVTFGLMFAILVESVDIAWTAYVFRNLKNNGYVASGSVVHLALFYLSAYLLYFILIDSIYFYVIDVRYIDSVNISKVIACGSLFKGLQSIILPVNSYSRSDRSSIYSILDIAVIVFSPLLIFALSKPWGAIGAAIAVALSFFFAAINAWAMFFISFRYRVRRGN